MKTKQELIEALADKTGQTKKDAAAFVEALGGIVRDTLAEGGEAVLPGIGRFSVKERQSRDGRNPQTGETIKIAARKVPAFIAGKPLKDATAGLSSC